MPALETPNAKLVKPAVLMLSRWQADFSVDTDASDKQIGYTLLQKKLDRRETAIEYWPRSLYDAKQA